MLSGVYCRVGKPQQLLTRVKPWLPFFSPFLKLQLDQAQARAYFSAMHNRDFSVWCLAVSRCQEQ